MGLAADIVDDIQEILEDTDGFSVEIKLTAPAPGSEEATINGFHAKHHLGISSQTGAAINSLKANVAFHEKTLIAANAEYPIRNADGKITFKDHIVKVKDIHGTLKSYKAGQYFPDETNGIIVLILEDYADA